MDEFESFEYWELNKEIEKLDSEYDGYKLLPLNQIAEINITRDVFKEFKNDLYIPAIGNTDVIDEMPNLNSKKKPQNYFQIVVNSEAVQKEYLFNYFNN